MANKINLINEIFCVKIVEVCYNMLVKGSNNDAILLFFITLIRRLS